jgi:threonine synthase
MAHIWRGVIEEYRDRLPIAPNDVVVSLGEGGTPLVYACTLSELTGAKVYLKVEGMNPTGSFKDRGMTMAITDAARQRRESSSLCINWKHQRLGCCLCD